MKAAKTAEIQAGQDQIDAKTQELATTDEKRAEAKENLDDTESLNRCRVAGAIAIDRA